MWSRLGRLRGLESIVVVGVGQGARRAGCARGKRKADARLGRLRGLRDIRSTRGRLGATRLVNP